MHSRDTPGETNEIACLNCRTPLGADARNGFCPHCLFTQAARFDPAVDEPDSDAVFPQPFGEYELLDEIARGGMGIVFRARQTNLGRIVAVKVLLGGSFVSAQSGRRFRAEAEAIAALSHPNIVAIHEVGMIEGQDYFSMEYVEGESLAGRLLRGPVPARKAARYVKTIAHAIHYAHGRGILHRDLKPSNVLIDARDEPRITDFGLARRLDGDSELTMTGQVLGSPNYMPPEQASARRGEVSPQSDVYSLGAMLYHLVTGRPPFVGQDFTETLEQVLHAPPPPLRLLNPTLPRDLETLCLKCLEKEPGRRYATAEALADDLGRFLRGEAIRARPVSLAEKARRWCVRKPAAAAAIGLAALLAATLVAGSVSLILRSQREREQIYQADMNLARQAWEENNVGRIRELLEATRHSPDRGFEWDYWQRQTHRAEKSFEHQADVAIAVAFSPDGAQVMGGFLNQSAKVWDLESQRVIAIHPPADSPTPGVPTPIAFSRDGQRVCVGYSGNRARLMEIFSGRDLGYLEGHASPLEFVAFSNDGRLLATGSGDGMVMVWDTTSHARIAAWKAHDRKAWTAAFSPDGRRLATGSTDRTARIWDIATGREVDRINHSDQVNGLAFFPDGRRLVTGSRDQTAKVWDLEKHEPLHILEHSLGVEAVDISHDGSRIVTGCTDQTAKLWDAATGRMLREFKGHRAAVVAVGFSPDGRRIVTGSIDKAVKVWDLETPDPPLTLPGHTNAIWSVAFSPSGDRLVSGSWDSQAVIWDTAAGRELRRIGNNQPVVSAKFSPDGTRIATVGWNGMARVSDAMNGGDLLRLDGHTAAVMSVAFSPAGDRLATVSTDGTAKIWSAVDGKLLQTFSGHGGEMNSVAFSPDGHRVLTGAFDGSARIWDAFSGRETLKIQAHDEPIHSAAFSPDGRWIATGSDDGTAKVWEADTGRLLLTLRGHSDLIKSVAFSPDGRRIVTGSWDRTAKVWETRHGNEMLTLKGHTGPVLSVAFSPDGRNIATASYDQTVRIWQAATPEQLAAWEMEEAIPR